MKTKVTVNVASTDSELNGRNFARADIFKYVGSIMKS
jgi:hypothetical protein